MSDHPERSTARRWRWSFVLVLAALIALAPALAEARAGGGASQGSRGSRTYQSNQARPMDRSMAPQTSPSTQATRPAPGAPSFGTPLARPGFAQRNPFLTGLIGGFIGAGIAGMIFGHSAWAADGSAAGSALGLLLQLLVIGGLVYLAVQFFRRRSGAVQGGLMRGAGFPGGGIPRSVGAMAAPASRDAVAIAITEADYNAWSALLVDVQEAWSKGDLMRLRQSVTPEMLGYFSEQLAANASRGVENRVEDVMLLKGDVEEAWDEGELQYVTARLRWSARDYTLRVGTGEVVEGDKSQPVEVTEIWTFVRSHGGRWLLSAIQQV